MPVRLPPQGLIDRGAAPSNPPQPEQYPPTAWLASMKGFAIPVWWSDLQPNATTDALTGDVVNRTGIYAIQDGIAFCQAHNMTAKVRVFMGRRSPAWAKAINDPAATTAFPSGIPWTDQSSSNSDTMVSFWTPALLAAGKVLYQKLAQLYDTSAQLFEMCISTETTMFAENLLRQYNDTTNAWAVNYDNVNLPTWSNAVLAGYTRQKDQAAVLQVIDDAFASGFTNLNLSMAFNPHQGSSFQDVLQGTDYTVAGTTLTATNANRWLGLNFGHNRSWPAIGHGGTVTLSCALFFSTSNRAYQINGNTAGTINVTSSTGTNITTGATTATSLATETGQAVVVCVGVDETFTEYVIDYLANKGDHASLGNLSARFPVQTGGYPAMYAKIATHAGQRTIYFQTAADNQINSSGTSLSPLEDALNWSVGIGANYIELPNGYDAFFTGTVTSATGTTVTTTGAGWGVNTWGAAAGKFGNVVFATSGNSYFVTSNTNSVLTIAAGSDTGNGATVTYTASTLVDTSKNWRWNIWPGATVTVGASTATVVSSTLTTLTLSAWSAGTPAAAAAYTVAQPATIRAGDQAGGGGYTVFKWDYMAPAEAAIWNPRFASLPLGALTPGIVEMDLAPVAVLDLTLDVV